VPTVDSKRHYCHIRRGTLKPASVLPGSRVLAADLQRSPVVAAYDDWYTQSRADLNAQNIFCWQKPAHAR